jgi:FPC/CPF motif-containing protein YcgG
MAEIDLADSSFSSYVLINLFADALRKTGKHRDIISMSYDVENGLQIVDEKNVMWKLEVNLKVKIPQEYIDRYKTIQDNDAAAFCVECNRAMIGERKTCKICSYLKKA